jgi:hypothetical protein
MRISMRVAARASTLLAVVVLLAAVAAACGSSKAATMASPSASSLAAIKAEIKADWAQFFAGGAPQKIALLENGQRFAKTIQTLTQSPLAKSLAAKVSSVKLTSPTMATVKYSILLGKQVALANQTGQAVLQGGRWKVSAQSFQALLALIGAATSSPSASP